MNSVFWPNLYSARLCCIYFSLIDKLLWLNIVDRFQRNNMLRIRWFILTDVYTIVAWLHTLPFFHLRVVLRQLFDTVKSKYQKSKENATDSNYLRCHALLTALHFPLETTWSCKQDRKERYWGQQFWQMERDISVRPTEMTRPVTVDHLQSWSRIFRSDQTEMVRSIWCTNRNFQNFGVNGKRPMFVFLLKTVKVFDVMHMISTQTAGKTIGNRFASCESIVWISFKRIYGK